jgi:TPR repeat protein
MRFPFPLAWTALAALVLPSLQAAKAPADPKASAPILMSKTGGGGGWADVKELQAAAVKGNPKAQTQLGEMLLRGDGIAKDEARGREMLERAARAGNSSAAFRIGMMLANGEFGAAKDPERALAYFRAAAAGGEKEAFFNIGAAYGSARGVKRDYGEALGWLIVAREHGATADAENALRTQIKAQPAWIAKGERRAKEIAQEFTGKKVADFLPPAAPLASVATAPAITNEALKPTGPTAPPPSLKPSIDLRPAPPSLPPPSIQK